MNYLKKAYYLVALLMVLFVSGFVLTGCNDTSSTESPSASGNPSAAESSSAAEGSSVAEGFSAQESTQTAEEGGEDSRSMPRLDPDGVYTSKEDVRDYLILYGELPQNFITKKEARSLGWPGGYLEPYAPGKCIGGDRFGNYEGALPEEYGVSYWECDIDTLGAKKRGAKRIIYSNDGHIYYTGDHYKTFTLLYEEEP